MPPNSVRSFRRAAIRMFDPLVEHLFAHAHVVDIDAPTRRMRLLTLRSDKVRDLDWTPGQQIRVLVGDLTLRTYSVWSRNDDRFQLCVFDHEEDGPGATWSRTVRMGDRVTFWEPEGRFVINPEAGYHVFVGEETASVAFGAMMASLQDDARVHGVVEVASEEDVLALRRGKELKWLYRGESSAAGSPTLLQGVRQLVLPAEPGVAYVAGEARTCQAVRRLLVDERGWPRRNVLVKPFWAPGKRGMD